MRSIRALTLLWLRERPHDVGTVFAVADVPDVSATSPVQVDTGTADLWLRRGRAELVAPDALPPKKGRG